jgi:predicted negative regulator of RcsB-dependent stress response
MRPLFISICTALFILTAGESVFAASGLNKTVQQAYREILKLRVQNGQKILQPELQRDPENACALLIANYADFFTILVSQDENVYEKLRSRQESRLENLDDLSEKTPYKRYAEAEIKLQLAMCQIFFADEVQAAWNVRGAFLLLKENQQLYPDFIPNRKTLGLLQVVIGSVPDSYQWVFKILGMKGDVKTGLTNLNSAAQNPNPFQTEALIYREFAQDWINKNDAAGPKLLQKLATENPDNLLFTYLAMSMLKKNKQCDAALNFYQKRIIDSRYLAFPYLHHLAGDLYLYKGDYPRSLKENQYFLSHYAGKHYCKDARFKAYLACFLNNDLLGAQAYYSNIKNTGSAVVEEDKYAQKFIENREILNPLLMKARLHTDGGYYNLAMQALDNFSLKNGTSLKEKIEFYYRRGRIFQGLNKTDSAKACYEKTVQLSGNLPYYFAPNAALQLGYMAAENSDKETARLYFKKALSYPKHEYKNSIDSKAKVGLSTL